MNGPWSVVCVAGLWGFLLSTVGLILQGFPARGVLAGRPCLRWGAALLVSFACWMIGMSQA